jgi:hypothetical protein
MTEQHTKDVTPRTGQLPPDQQLLTELATQLVALGHGAYTNESACSKVLDIWSAAGDALASLPAVASQTTSPPAKPHSH